MPVLNLSKRTLNDPPVLSRHRFIYILRHRDVVVPPCATVRCIERVVGEFFIDGFNKSFFKRDCANDIGNPVSVISDPDRPIIGRFERQYSVIVFSIRVKITGFDCARSAPRVLWLHNDRFVKQVSLVILEPVLARSCTVSAMIYTEVLYCIKRRIVGFSRW